MQSLNTYCRTLKLPLNKKQNVEYVTERARQQFDHFTKELDGIIQGHRDQEFQDGLVAFITNLSLSDLTEDEKKLIFSNTLSQTKEGRIIRDNISQFLSREEFMRDLKRRKTLKM